MRNEKSKTDLARARQLKREGKIDVSDSPELTEEWFNSATYGARPPKVMLSMRVDADVMAFFRESIGPGYQRVIHDLLRRFVELKKAGARTEWKVSEERTASKKLAKSSNRVKAAASSRQRAKKSS